MRTLARLLSSLLLASTSLLAPLERTDLLPAVSGQRLDGLDVQLPAAARGHVTLLAFGFTRGSATAVQAYGERFRRAFGADSTCDWFEVPLFGGMAGLARPWITGAMRRATPEADRRHVITAWHGAADWKRRLDYREGDWAYLALLDREGRVLWRGRGAFEDSTWRELDAAVRRVR